MKKTYRSLLVAAAENAATHEKQARLQLELLKHAAEETSSFSIVGKRMLCNIAEHYSIATKERSTADIVSNLADALLEDIMCTEQDAQTSLHIVSPPERIQVWTKHTLLPTGSTSDMLCNMQVLSENGEENWQETEKMVLRFGAAFLLTSLISNTLIPHCICGVPERITTNVHFECLDADAITIALHEHIPGLADAVKKAANDNDQFTMLKDVCPAGIQVLGVGSKDEAAAATLPHLATFNGIGLALQTGAIDLLMADTLQLSPTITEAARSAKTPIVTANKTSHIPDATYLNNSATLEELAKSIVRHALSSFEDRRTIKQSLPETSVTAQVGFCKDSIDHYYGCMDIMASGLIEGKILGIVNLFGDAPATEEEAIEFSAFTETLLKNNILLFASGKTAFTTACNGLCSSNAREKCGRLLNQFLSPSMPPVWHFGEATDNVQQLATLREIAKYAGHKIKDLPLASVTSSLSTKDSGSTFALQLSGIDIYHRASASQQNTPQLLSSSTQENLGSTIHAAPSYDELAKIIISNFTANRSELCWR